MVKRSVRREVGVDSMPPLTPLPSAASNRSVRAATSTGTQLRSPASESCLTLAGTIDPTFIDCLSMNVTIQPSCLPSLNAVYIARAFRCPFIGHTGRRSCSPFAGWFPAGATISRPYDRLPNSCSTTKALTAGTPHPARQLSPLISRYLPNVPPPTTWCAPTSLYAPKQRIGRFSDFATYEQARRNTPPNRVRLLRTASSPPVASHPASQRRSYLRLRGLGLPRHGLAPCRYRAFTGALVPAQAGTQNSLARCTSCSTCAVRKHCAWRVESRSRQAHSVTQAHAARVAGRHAGGVNSRPRCLTSDENACPRIELEYRLHTMRQMRTSSSHSLNANMRTPDRPDPRQ